MLDTVKHVIQYHHSKPCQISLTQIGQFSHLTRNGIAQQIVINLEERQKFQIANPARDATRDLIVVQIELLQTLQVVYLIWYLAVELIEVHVQYEEALEVAILGRDGTGDRALFED